MGQKLTINGVNEGGGSNVQELDQGTQSHGGQRQLQSHNSIYIVQIQHKSSAAYVIAQSPAVFGRANEAAKFDIESYYDRQSLMYEDSLNSQNRHLSYFQIGSDGIIRHYFSNLIAGSDTATFRSGSTMCLRKMAGESADKHFAFTMTAEHGLMNIETGLYIQPESNGVCNGAKLTLGPILMEPNKGTLSHHLQFTITPVSMVELELEMKKLEAFRQNLIRGISPSTGVKPSVGNEERTSIIDPRAAESASITIGINRKIITTYSAPVKNLSLNKSGKYSLSDEADVDEIWSLEALHSEPKLAGTDSISGAAVRFRNKAGFYLCCSEYGELFAAAPEVSADGRPSMVAGSVWNIRVADKHLHYLCNDLFPFLLIRQGDAVQLAPMSSKVQDTYYWNVYDA